MNIRQRTLLVLILLGDALIVETIVLLGHMNDGVPLGLIIALTVFSGYMVGFLEQKWKRDKEMASIVAERLLGRSKDTSYANGQMNPNVAQKLVQQANAMNSSLIGAGAGSSQGAFSSLLGKQK